jgi:hypothetical protein
MQDLLTKAVATTQTAAAATLDLHSEINSAGMACARGSLALMGKPFDVAATNALMQDMFEAHKKALTTWAKVQGDLLAQVIPAHKA